MEQLRTEQLKKEEFDKVYEIMDASFPAIERRSYEKQRDLLDDPRYRILVKRDGDDIRAFIALWDLGEWIFAEHLAVAPGQRNGGLGARFLNEVMDDAGKRICLEVELPETEFAERRIAFYERNGFSLNRYPYEQLPLSEGDVRMPLYVMTSGGELSDDSFAELKRLIYRNIYGAEV